MKTTILKFITFSCLISACGDPVDTTEDCSNTEYFDDQRELCFGCPPVLAPSCPDACGFEILVKDSKSTGADRCPIAQCSSIDTCDICSPSSYFSDETLSCVECSGAQSCENGQKLERRITDGRCYTECR